MKEKELKEMSLIRDLMIFDFPMPLIYGMMIISFSYGSVFNIELIDPDDNKIKGKTQMECTGHFKEMYSLDMADRNYKDYFKYIKS